MGTVLLMVTLMTAFCLYTVMTLPKSGSPPDLLSAPPAAKSDPATEKLGKLLVEARTIEQQYQQQQTPASVNQFEEVGKNLLAQAQEVEKNAKQSNDPKSAQAAAQIVQLVTLYNTSFRELVQASERKGGAKDTGPGPQNRQTGQKPSTPKPTGNIQKLEEALLKFNRAEQNYFAARSGENQRLLVNAANLLAKAAGESGLESSVLQSINTSISNYTSAFDRYQAVSLATSDPTLSAAFAAEQIKQEQAMHKATLELEKLIRSQKPSQPAASSATPAAPSENMEELAASVNKNFSALQARINALSVKKEAPSPPEKISTVGLTPQLSFLIIAGSWLLIVLVTLFLARMLFTFVTSPIQRMKDIAQRMASQGDFSLTFPPEKNEFGGLAIALNSLVHQQKTNATDNNEAAAAELTTKTVNLTRCILDKVNHDTRIADVVAVQEDMLTRLRSTVELINADTGLLRQAAGGLTEHGQAVRQAAAGCEQSVAATMETVQAITQSAEQVGPIITAFTDLAEQTSVTALNAAIKATRSGTQGKEFSTVTEALDRLAKRATETAKEITQLLNNMTSRLAAGEKLGNESRQAMQHLASISSSDLQALSEIEKTANELQQGSGDTATLLAKLDEISSQVFSLVRELGPLNKTVEGALAQLGTATGTSVVADLNLEDMVKKMMQDYPEDDTGQALSAGAADFAERS
jgi:methyl-accepting chemotaxis protein